MADSLDLQLDKFQHLLKIKKQESKRYIWDFIRSKWLVLQPEEVVRQLLIHHLIEVEGLSKNRIAIEKGLTVNSLYKRSDILIYSREMDPYLLIECKAPSVKLNQAVFEQIAQYNRTLKVPFLLVSNGISTYCCKINFEEKCFHFLDEIPLG